MRRVFVIGAASLAAAAAPALTAHAPRPAGVVAGRVSGFRITNVAFSLDRARPDRIGSVSFELAPASASTVRVALGERRAACGVRAGLAVCRFDGHGPPLDELASLTVLAAS